MMVHIFGALKSPIDGILFVNTPRNKRDTHRVSLSFWECTHESARTPRDSVNPSRPPSLPDLDPRTAYTYNIMMFSPSVAACLPLTALRRNGRRARRHPSAKERNDFRGLHRRDADSPSPALERVAFVRCDAGLNGKNCKYVEYVKKRLTKKVDKWNGLCYNLCIHIFARSFSAPSCRFWQCMAWKNHAGY